MKYGARASVDRGRRHEVRRRRAQLRFTRMALLLRLCVVLQLLSGLRALAMKRILVTGGNKGIGKAICEKLLTEWPDTFVLLGSRDAQRGEQAVQDIVKNLGGNCKDRLQLLVLDTSSSSSVKRAADSLDASTELYGIVNNAGLGFNDSCEQTISTNYFGPRRVVEAFGKFLKRPGGRIVNQASASGPNYVSSCNDKGVQQKLAKPWTIAGGIAEVDDMAQTMISSNDANPYGASKALLNAYTCLLAKTEPDLVVNSCTPGWILTDMTAGSAASGTPSKGAGPACYLLMDEETVPKQPTGRYYGSDCVRSPISFYRGPGEPPYESDEDLVGLPETAKKEAPLLL